jgi:sensor c-di-GMP phosphodiesterase-like protein
VKEFAIYTAARLGLFLLSYAAVVGVYLLVGGGDRIPVLWPFLLAVVVSAIASVTLLRNQRDAFAMSVQQRAERAAARRRMVAAEEERSAGRASPPADEDDR